MDIYNYDGTTGRYLGQSQSDRDPLDPDRKLIPAFATEIAPPPEIMGFARVFVDGDWRYAAINEPDEEPVLASVISEYLVRQEAGRRLKNLARPYVSEERETWHKQIKEAEALIADPEASAPLLSRRAAARGMTLIAYAANVLAKDDAFSAASGDILAAQDRLLAMVPIPTNFDDDIYWS